MKVCDARSSAWTRGVSEPVSGIPDSTVFSTLDYRLDGELYMLMSEGSPGPNGDARSTLYRINGSVAKVALSQRLIREQRAGPSGPRLPRPVPSRHRGPRLRRGWSPSRSGV